MQVSTEIGSPPSAPCMLPTTRSSTYETLCSADALESGLMPTKNLALNSNLLLLHTERYKQEEERGGSAEMRKRIENKKNREPETKQ